MCCKHTHLLIGCCFCSVNPTESMVGPCLWSLFAWYYSGYLYRPYYSYYYYYHTVPHILIFSNKDCSNLPNLQCAFCWFPCVLPLFPSSLCAVTETVPSLYMCSHFSAVFDRVFLQVAALLPLERGQPNFLIHRKQNACLYQNTQTLVM